MEQGPPEGKGPLAERPAATFVVHHPAACSVALFLVARGLLSVVLDDGPVSYYLDPTKANETALAAGAVLFGGALAASRRALRKAGAPPPPALPALLRVALVLGIIFAAGIGLGAILRARIPPGARPEALEARFSEQFEQLRQYALRFDTRGDRRKQPPEPDPSAFNDRAILEADVWKRRGRSSRSGHMVKRAESPPTGMSTWFPRHASPGHPAVNVWTREGGTVLEYEAVAGKRGGEVRGYTVLFDLAALDPR